MVIYNAKELHHIEKSTKPLIILLPYAGGNIYSYRPFFNQLDLYFDVLPIELPGRGELSSLKILSDINEITQFIHVNYFNKILLNKDYYIYGHSMGAIIAYELSCLLRGQRKKLPKHIIISGREGPSAISSKKELHQLPSTEFYKELYKMGGIPNDIINNLELMKFLEPTLRGDIRAVEMYKCAFQDKLNIPMTVFYGDQEDLSINNLYLWSNVIKQDVLYKEFHGNHFFIFEHKNEIINYMSNLI